MSRTFIALMVLAFTSGCATSKDVVVNPSAVGRDLTSVYLVVHGDKSSDVDAAIQRELLKKGISVLTGAEGQHPANADLILRYNDSWNWDITMYLDALDMQFSDAASGALVATATWNNSALHGYHGLDGVVEGLVSEVLKKLSIPRR
ncbi:MAG: hypothetical protein KY459_09260 [Acidobacteria bacterium]|nr:hypothetical protein [Acidobacteriota bacterium]